MTGLPYTYGGQVGANGEYVNPTGTENSQARGVDLELEYNPMSNWTMKFTFRKQNTTVSDAATQAKLYKDLQTKLIDIQSDAFLETQIVRHAMDKCLDGYVPVPMQSFDYAFYKYKWTCK